MWSDVIYRRCKVARRCYLDGECRAQNQDPIGALFALLFFSFFFDRVMCKVELMGLEMQLSLTQENHQPANITTQPSLATAKPPFSLHPLHQ